MSLPCSRRSRRSLAPLVLGLALLAALTVVPSATGTPAEAATRWAPASRAAIHPGVQMYTRGAQCSGNFVFEDRRGHVYVGYAAHCAGLGGATDTDGCKARSLPLGTRVRFAQGGSLVADGRAVGFGRLAYSSWATMRRLHVRSPRVCGYNDLALVRVRSADVRKVNPTVPFWGGPVGVHRGPTTVGETVYSYGSSLLRAGVAALSPKQGSSLGTTEGGWSHLVYTATPGVPGDSGSGFLDAQGNALGVLSTLSLTPLVGSNGVGDLSHELAFAQRHSGIPGLRLVHGTERFRPLL